MAYDATATYVLYYTGSQFRIGKRTNAGAFSSRALYNWSGARRPTGDVIARGGRWFGVFSVQVGPGGEFARMELFSAGTGLPVRRVTTSGDNYEPTLAYTGAGRSIPVLIWRRPTGPASPEPPTNLMVKKLIGGVWEPERVFASLGTHNGSPDMTVRGRLTFVTWTRDGAIMVASNPGGTFTSHRFLTAGFRPRVAASTTAGAVDHVFVTWTATPTGTDRVFFAETATTGSVQGTWNGAFLTPLGSISRVFGIGAFATKATVTYATGPNMVARTQT